MITMPPTPQAPNDTRTRAFTNEAMRSQLGPPMQRLVWECDQLVTAVK